MDAYAGCIAGAMIKDTYLQAVALAGFTDNEIKAETSFPLDLMANDPVAMQAADALHLDGSEFTRLAATIKSIKLFARKPY